MFTTKKGGTQLVSSINVRCLSFGTKSSSFYRCRTSNNSAFFPWSWWEQYLKTQKNTQDTWSSCILTFQISICLEWVWRDWKTITTNNITQMLSNLARRSYVCAPWAGCLYYIAVLASQNKEIVKSIRLQDGWDRQGSNTSSNTYLFHVFLQITWDSISSSVK